MFDQPERDNHAADVTRSLKQAAVAVLVAALAVAGCGGPGGQAASSTTVTSQAAAGTTKATSDTPAKAAAAGPATFAGPDGVEAHWVIAENKKPGTTAWHLSGEANGASINGFASLTAASVGDRIRLYVTTHAARYHISAYRIGYYDGKGGRLVWKSGELQRASPAHLHGGGEHQHGGV